MKRFNESILFVEVGMTYEKWKSFIKKYVWHMRNGQFSYKKRGTKNEKFNKTYRNGNFLFCSTFLYEVEYDIWKIKYSHIKVYQVELEIWMIYGKCEICL